MRMLKMLRDISDLKKEVATLRPVRSPGVLTSFTTRGTFIQPISSASGQSQTSKNSTVARWA